MTLSVSAEKSSFPLWLGKVLSDCVCEENAKFPEYLFEETIHGVPLRQYLLPCLMFITRFYSDEEKTWVGLLD